MGCLLRCIPSLFMTKNWGYVLFLLSSVGQKNVRGDFGTREQITKIETYFSIFDLSLPYFDKKSAIKQRKWVFYEKECHLTENNVFIYPHKHFTNKEDWDLRFHIEWVGNTISIGETKSISLHAFVGFVLSLCRLCPLGSMNWIFDQSTEATLWDGRSELTIHVHLCLMSGRSAKVGGVLRGYN